MQKKNEIAWAAGLFEGEGTITIKQEKRDRKPRPRLELQMTDSDVVFKFKKILKAGHAKLRKKRTKSGKKVFRWYVIRKDDIQRILKSFIPYLGIRRKSRAKKALKYAKYIKRER